MKHDQLCIDAEEETYRRSAYVGLMWLGCTLSVVVVYYPPSRTKILYCSYSSNLFTLLRQKDYSFLWKKMHSSLASLSHGALIALSTFITLATRSEAAPLLEQVTSFGINTPAGKIEYTRDAYWHGESLFDNFDFMTSKQYVATSGLNRPDPTNGFVDYIDKDTGVNSSLITFTNEGNPRWGVDASHKYTPGKDWGRPSIRIEGKKSWTHGLFVFDIAHMPGGSCGIWPALWSLGSGEWPYNGEIDILEGVHRNKNNQMVIHTGDNCTMSTPDDSALSPIFDSSGDTLVNGDPAGNCALSFSSGGCRVQGSTENNYGDGFNSNGGGVYVMQWTSNTIKIWFFPRDKVDQEMQALLSVNSDSVDISKFGLPEATFAGGRNCNMADHFKEHRIIFDTTFCGDWAGSAWPSRCPSVNGKTRKESCEIYVGNNPDSYKDAYWEINSISIFKESAAS